MSEAEDYDVVSFAESPSVKSVPLFLPSNMAYDPATQTISENKDAEPLGDGDDDLDGPQYPLVLVPEAGAKILQSVKNAPISCISCVGPYRTGKSLLMSRFLKDSKAFQVGPTLEGCTRGIWISTSAIVGNDNCHTFLLDCEGAGDPLEGDEASNVRIALTCILISSIFLFNNTGRPDRGSLQFLSYLTTIRKRLPTPSADDADADNKHFPSFLWVFRDFFLQLPKRKKTADHYTLQEYMLERVLVSSNSGNPDDTVVESLLNDFQSMDVLKIGYPRKGEESFTPDEMSKLDDVAWDDFDDDFRADVGAVIAMCRSKATPFTLSSATGGKETVATGPIFVEWCNRVLALVNSEDTIPNLPDLQHQLLQTIADGELEKAVDSYKESMQGYLDACPPYNDNETTKETTDALVETYNLEGVAEKTDLVDKSEEFASALAETMKEAIGSPPLADVTMQRLQSMCTDESAASSSFLSKLVSLNKDRSEASCLALARSMYFEMRENVRDDATNITEDDFAAMVSALLENFRSSARGPAVEGTIDTFIKEQEEADVNFLNKVRGIYELYQTTMKEKEELDAKVKETEQKVEELEITMEETKQEHAEQVKTLNAEAEANVQKLNADHEEAMGVAIAEQQEIQATKLNELTEDMNAKIEVLHQERKAELEAKELELENAKQDAERKLAEEINAREDHLKKTEASHASQIEELMKVADEKMQGEIVAAESKRKKEITVLNEEMTSKLHEAEERMRLEILEREKRLNEEEEKHRDELEKTRLKLLKEQDEEREKYLRQIDDLNARCFNPQCCTM